MSSGAESSKKQLDVPEEVAERITWLYAAASYNVTTDESSWQTLKSNVFARKQCNPVTLLDVSGSAWVSGSDAKVTLHLSDFICRNQGFLDPIVVVATPTSADRPSFLTLEHSLIDDGNDVEMTFWLWNPDGTAVKEATSFDWRCRVPSFDIIV